MADESNKEFRADPRTAAGLVGGPDKTPTDLRPGVIVLDTVPKPAEEDIPYPLEITELKREIFSRVRSSLQSFVGTPLDDRGLHNMQQLVDQIMYRWTVLYGELSFKLKVIKDPSDPNRAIVTIIEDGKERTQDDGRVFKQYVIEGWFDDGEECKLRSRLEELLDGLYFDAYFEPGPHWLPKVSAIPAERQEQDEYLDNQHSALKAELKEAQERVRKLIEERDRKLIEERDRWMALIKKEDS